MAYAVMKSCGRVLLFTLLVIQLWAFAFYQTKGHVKSLWQVIVLVMYSGTFCCCSMIFLMEAIRNDIYILSWLFFWWKLYVGCVFVPNVIGIFRIAFSFEEDKLPYSVNGLTLTVCATPILLLLLLITADDSFSSKTHRDLVRNLSILMVSDLYDGIEMLDSTLKGNSYGIHKNFLILGAVMIIVLSSFQMAEYKFVGGELMEQPIYTTTVIRNIFVIILNLVFLIVRVKVSRSILIIFKNCMAIILSVIQICYLTLHT